MRRSLAVLTRRPFPHLRLALGAVLAVAFCGATLGIASPAQAGSVEIDCGVLDPHWYCINHTSAEYFQVWSRYAGQQEILVSGKVIFASNGRGWGEAFGLSNYGSNVKLFIYRERTFKPLVSNQSAFPHTVTGTGYYLED